MSLARGVICLALAGLSSVDVDDKRQKVAAMMPVPVCEAVGHTLDGAIPQKIYFQGFSVAPGIGDRIKSLFFQSNTDQRVTRVVVTYDSDKDIYNTTVCRGKHITNHSYKFTLGATDMQDALEMIN